MLPETGAMAALGNALRTSQRKEALPVLEANLALVRRYFSQSDDAILAAQTNIGSCLDELGRDEDALALKRAIFAKRAATVGVSHERTILAGSHLVVSLQRVHRWDEATALLRDQLLSVARRLLGADHDLSIALSLSLAVCLSDSPERTRYDPRLNRPRFVLARRRRDPF